RAMPRWGTCTSPRTASVITTGAILDQCSATATTGCASPTSPASGGSSTAATGAKATCACITCGGSSVSLTRRAPPVGSPITGGPTSATRTTSDAGLSAGLTPRAYGLLVPGDPKDHPARAVLPLH